MKAIATALLAWSAKRVLARHKPYTIAVAGSVGKTSTIAAIAAVLQTTYAVRVPEQHVSHRASLSLAVLGMGAPVSYGGWTRVALNALSFGLRPPAEYPTHLILEMSTDRRGDMKRFLELVSPQMVVVTPLTRVQEVHYGSLRPLMEETADLVRCIPADGLTVLHGDDEQAMSMKSVSQAPVATYGSGSAAEVAVEEYGFTTREDDAFTDGETVCETQILIRDRRSEAPGVTVTLRNMLGGASAESIAAALLVGNYLHVSFEQAIKALEGHYQAIPGRMRPLYGIKGALILDDSYNASPQSAAAAMQVLKKFDPVEGARRIAVLGEMADLGAQTEPEHRQLGWRAAEAGVDLLIAVGEKSRDTARGAIEAGMKEDQIVLKKNAIEAGEYLDEQIQKGDIVLIKGSQVSRMERAVERVMAHPEQAGSLLVRQEAEWK